MHISITGLKPKGLISYVKFWQLAIPSFNQARQAKGNLFCETKLVRGYQCTLTAWESREAMLDYMRNGAHLKALKAFSSIATGQTYGFEAQEVPNWNTAFRLLSENGKSY